MKVDMTVVIVDREVVITSLTIIVLIIIRTVVMTVIMTAVMTVTPLNIPIKIIFYLKPSEKAT